MNATAAAPTPSDSARVAALRRQSDDHWKFALQASARGRSSSATGSAYQAGYCALLSVLSADEIQALADHPSAAAASLSATRLHLKPDVQALAERGAAGYYTADHAAFNSPAEWFDWAEQVRRAAGWND